MRGFRNSCASTPRRFIRNILRIISPERKLWYQIPPSAQAGVDVRVHSVTGRHRPQRCRQTDKGRGGGGVCPSGRLREVAKDRCSRVTAVLSTPRPLGRMPPQSTTMNSKTARKHAAMTLLCPFFYSLIFSQLAAVQPTITAGCGTACFRSAIPFAAGNLP
ncbi:MAG: hypothetical protein RLZZ398_1419 [Verrucomicrobiota bacterium]|jgi:hypothetical protein